LTKEKPEPLTVGLAIAGPDVHFISFSFAVHQQFPGRKFFDELLYLFCTLVLLSADGSGRQDVEYPAIAKPWTLAHI
jgi:hypothetical protein